MIQTYDPNGNKLYLFDPSREITRGGEGMIFSVPNKKKLAAKLYLPNITPLKEKKFDFLNKLNEDLFVKPKELLYDKQGKVTGFVMEYLKQDNFPLDSIYNKNFCLQNNISFIEKEKIAKKLIEAVKYAHSLNIIIGDLSGLNILTDKNGEIKFIDVDSYEVPGFKHSGKLLDDIRDYLHNGTISINSDYFSLSVVCFNFFTFMHPFKGVHAKYFKLFERMIHKIPVFVNDKDLKLPKCYEPLSDVHLQDQYNALYLKGDRFLLSIDKYIKITPAKVQKTVLTQGQLMIQTIFEGETIEFADFSSNQGLVRTKTHFRIYDAPQKGAMYFKGTVDRKEFQDLFIGSKNIIGYKNEKLCLYDKTTSQAEEITNITLSQDNKFYHTENILVSLDDDYMYVLDLDIVRYKNIKYERNKVFSDSFKTLHGIIQNVAGTQYLHFKSGNYISSIKIPILNVKGVLMRKDVGILQYVDNNTVKFQFFKIENMKIEMMNLFADSFLYFAYSGENIKNSCIFVPADNAIMVYRSLDMALISQIDCDVIDTDSKLFYTTSGIIAVNESQMFLLNKK